MIQRVTQHPGYLIRFNPDKTSRRAFLFLHGFPAHRGVKNLDLADAVFRRFDCATYLLHYKGLGDSPGTFRFTESIAEAVRALDLIHTLENAPITLVGHSWGGMVATNVLHQRPSKIDRLVLLSPFCDITASPELRDWMMHGVRNDVPGIYGNLTDDELRTDFRTVEENHLPIHLAATLPAQVPIAILQAKKDETTPPVATRAFASRLKTPAYYAEVDMDHSFSEDRPRFAATLIGLLEGATT